MAVTLVRLKPKPHWTPAYIADRLALMWWAKRRPDAPWLVRQAVEFLDGWLRPTDTVVEFGSGRSTLWFSRRVGRVISIEHNPAWHSTVGTTLAGAGADNVARHLDPSGGQRAEAYLAPALEAAAAPGARFDMILVDGIHRDACALWALGAIARPGGLIVIDNCNRYFPSRTRTPYSLGPSQPHPSPEWKRFAHGASSLRRAWLSNGVTDTLLYFT